MLGLHRGRFALTLKNSIALTNDGGRIYGVGLAATQFFNEWFGIEIEAAWTHDLAPGEDGGNELIARALAHLEFEAMHAHGSLAKSDRGNVLDLFFNPGAGAMIDRNRTYLPANPNHYVPDFLYSLGMGLRAFLTRSTALTFETDVYLFNQHGQREGSIGVGPVAQLGFTWFMSPAREWQK